VPRRWYCVQVAHSVHGWIDLPSLASTRKLEAVTLAGTFSEGQGVVTRVIRKPHGWEPPTGSDDPMDTAETALLHADAVEVEPVQLDPEDSPKRARKHEKALKKRPPTWHTRITGKDPF